MSEERLLEYLKKKARRQKIAESAEIVRRAVQKLNRTEWRNAYKALWELVDLAENPEKPNG